MTADWRGPGWLKPFISEAGGTIFHRVTAVHLVGREVPDALLQLKYLKNLKLDMSHISNGQLRRLRQLKSFEHLAIRGSHVTDEMVQQLAEFKQLERLSLHSTSVTDRGVQELQQALPRLAIIRSPAPPSKPPCGVGCIAMSLSCPSTR